MVMIPNSTLYFGIMNHFFHDQTVIRQIGSKIVMMLFVCLFFAVNSELLCAIEAAHSRFCYVPSLYLNFDD